MTSFPELKTILYLLLGLSALNLGAENLIRNPTFLPERGKTGLPGDYTLDGDAVHANLGKLHREASGHGVRLLSGKDQDGDGAIAGSVSVSVRQGIPRQAERWMRFRIRGLAQEGFAVRQSDLHLKAEFFARQGKVPLDHVQARVYGIIERERKDLKDSGTNRSLGTATWRNYTLDFRTPFRQGFGKGRDSEFWINEMELFSIPTPPGQASPKSPPPILSKDLKDMVPIGGRWYYDPQGGKKMVPKVFDHKNAGQLLYASGQPIAPFAGNMTSWLREGWMDLRGHVVKEDRFVPDNLTIRIEKDSLILHSRNLPNHPTAIFPDVYRAVDGNPNRIQEKNNTWHIPLEPRENPRRKAMDKRNSNQALPRGPIGVAVNGVIFFNPFDHINEADAVWRMDRCCGHPAPNSAYHYHKYPVCVKSPWRDEGESHSPVIGFAFDGFPVHGPYEAKDELARASRTNPLNEFNLHRDDLRGWHYHVTPGQFPHIIGGYWGKVDTRNRRGPPPGRGNLGRPGGGRRPPPHFPPPRRRK